MDKPNQVIFGKVLSTPSDRKLQIEPNPEPKEREEIEEEVRDKIGKAQLKQKKQYDKNVRDKNLFNPGDLVMLINSRQKVGQMRSFTPKFTELVISTTKLTKEVIKPV